MKTRNILVTIEASSSLAQAALKKYIKKALEREALIDVAQVTVQTVQPVKAQEQKFIGEPAFGDDEEVA